MQVRITNKFGHLWIQSEREEGLRIISSYVDKIDMMDPSGTVGAVRY